MATPQQPMGAPGVGKPPSLYSQRAHQILQSLLGTPTPGMGPGVGQDVGAGSDVGVGAAIAPPPAPADVNQNTLPGLTPSQAAAFCGPAGVLDLMQQYEGGNIPVDAVVQKAQQRDPRTGRPYWQGQMNGPQEFANLLDEFGYEPTMISLEGGNAASGWRQVESALRRGQRVVVDTPGHYFQLEGVDPSGAIRMGDVIGQRRGTINGPQDITSMGQGAPRTAITATPRAGGSAEARQIPQDGPMQLLGAQSQGGQISQWDDLIRRYAPADLRNDHNFIYAVNVGIHGESGGNAAQRQHGGGRGVGLYQIQDPVTFDRTDPEASTRYMMPRYVNAYRRVQQENANLSPQDQAVLTSAYAERPYGVTRDQNGADQFDMNSTAAANYRRAAAGLPSPGQGGLQLLGNVAVEPSDLPEWLRNAVANHGAPGSPTPAPTPPAASVPGAGIINRPSIQAAGQMLQPGIQTARDVVGGAASAAGGLVRGALDAGNRIAGVSQPLPPTATSTPLSPYGTPSPPRAGGPEFGGESGNWAIGDIPGAAAPAPTAPAPNNGLPQYGLAPDETITEWIYGPPIEGMETGGTARLPVAARTSAGRVISESDMPEYFKSVRAAVEREAIRQQIPAADIARLQQAREQHEADQAARAAQHTETIGIQRERNDATAANTAAQIGVREENAETRRQQERHFWAQLVGPDAMKFARSVMPYGFVHNPNDNSLGILDENGQVVSNVQGPPITQKDLHVPGRGYYGYRPDAEGNLVFTRSNVPGAEQVHEGTLLRETEEGTRRVGQLPTLPSAQFSVDEFGRIRALNQKTAESYLLTEGHPRIITSGGRTYIQQPTPVPRYTPPVFSPTTYGMPEIPWANQDSGTPFQRTPSGGAVVPDALYQAFMASRQQQQPEPQFVQPQPDEDAVPAGYDYTGGYGA